MQPEDGEGLHSLHRAMTSGDGWQVFRDPMLISTGNGMYGVWSQKNKVQRLALAQHCYNVVKGHEVIHEMLIIDT